MNQVCSLKNCDRHKKYYQGNKKYHHFKHLIEFLPEVKIDNHSKRRTKKQDWNTLKK